MPIVPATVREAIDWALAHNSVFQTQAASIGLTAAQATTFKNAALAADAAFAARENAANAAKAATLNQTTAVGAMRTVAGDTLRAIKAFAEAQANPAAVYALAQIPAPAVPSPRPAPGRPFDFKVTLNPGGSISLRWKCQNPPGTSGTVYHIYRRVGGGEVPATDLGTIGLREFTDTTVPASGAAVGVTYIVQAQRAELLGEASLPLTVQFGIGGGGGLSISSVTVGGQSVPVKSAA